MTEKKGFQVIAPPSSASLAERLEKELEGYRIHKDIIEKTGIHAVREIPESWLIVICTPDTPGDNAVCSVIEEYLSAGKRNRILTVLAEGTPVTSFPENIRFEKLPDGTVKEHEPLAANITAESARKAYSLLKTEKLRLLAPMLGVRFDDLMNRDRRQKARIRLAAGSAVMGAAAVFLIFTISRMQIIRQQNEKLQQQYAEAEEALAEAQEQKDAAQEALARTVAVTADGLLDAGNTELAMLLCLEYLPEMRQIEELTEVFEKALSVRCSAGFTPVTTKQAYERTRQMDSLSYAGGYTLLSESEDDVRPDTLPASMEILPPSGSGDKPYRPDDVHVSLKDYSAEYGYGVYQGTARWGETWNDADECLWIGSASDAEDSFYLRMTDGSLVTGVSAVKILPDGSLLLEKDDKTLLRFFVSGPAGPDKPVLKEENVRQIPVYDGETSLTEELPFEVTFFMERPGFSDRVHALNRDGIAVFESMPFRLLYIIEDENTRRFATAPNGSTYWNGTYLAILPDGSRRIIVGEQFVYDEEDGSFLFEIEDFGQSSGVRFLTQSSEGWLPLWRGQDIYFIDLADGHTVDVLHDLRETEFSLCGPADPVYGNRSASVMLLYSSVYTDKSADKYYYEYRAENIEVPETLEEQITLAKELLNGRELIPAERRKYHLDE